MSEAVIVDAIRTPIGRAVKGTLRDIRADDLAAVPLRALVERNPEVNFKETDDVMMGCGFPDHEQGYNVGRNALLLAGIDHHVPAVTVSRFCGNSRPQLRTAALTLSRDSRTARSGSPTSVNAASPRRTSTSTVTSWLATPSRAKVATQASIARPR